jgi:hypothetical protein
MCCLCVLTSVDIIGKYKAYPHFQLDRPPVLFSPAQLGRVSWQQYIPLLNLFIKGERVKKSLLHIKHWHVLLLMAPI